MKAMNNIELQIDQLVLRGFEGIDQHQVGSAIQNELSRLIREQGLPVSLNQPRVIGNMNAGKFKMGKSTGPRDIGTQVAKKIYKGMGQ
jgi:hypothetical protein